MASYMLSHGGIKEIASEKRIILSYRKRKVSQMSNQPFQYFNSVHDND